MKSLTSLQLYELQLDNALYFAKCRARWFVALRQQLNDHPGIYKMPGTYNLNLTSTPYSKRWNGKRWVKNKK